VRDLHHLLLTLNHASGCLPPLTSSCMLLSLLSSYFSFQVPLFLSFPSHLLSPSWICFTLHCSSLSKDPGWMSHPLTICCHEPLQASTPSKDPSAVPQLTWTYVYACSHTRLHTVLLLYKAM